MQGLVLSGCKRPPACPWDGPIVAAVLHFRPISRLSRFRAANVVKTAAVRHISVESPFPQENE